MQTPYGLHTITGRATKCGPSAISSITGIPTHEAAAAIRSITGKRAVNGVSTRHLRQTLLSLGYVCSWAICHQKLAQHWDADNQHWDAIESWTLARFIAVAYERGGTWVLSCGASNGGHYVSTAGGMVADSGNWFRRKPSYYDGSRARTRVKAALLFAKGETK